MTASISLGATSCPFLTYLEHYKYMLVNKMTFFLHTKKIDKNSMNTSSLFVVLDIFQLKLSFFLVVYLRHLSDTSVICRRRHRKRGNHDTRN